MVFVQKSKQHVWLFFLLLVLGSNLVLYRTDFGVNILEQSDYSGVVLGSLIDLVIVAPILCLVWKKQRSIKRLILLMASGLILARFLIPINYLKPFVAVTWLGFAIEIAFLLLELLLIVTLFRYLPKIIASIKQNSLPILFAFPKAVDHHVNQHPIIQIICSEMLMFYYAFASWRNKPKYCTNTLTIHKNSSYIAFQIMLIHAIVIETLGIHWWLHDKSMVLSILLLVLNIYSVIFILADIQAIRLTPLYIDENQFYISLGLMKRMEIRWDEIEEIITDPKELQQKMTKDTIDFIPRDFMEVYPDVILKLKKPKEAVLIMGMKKTYGRVAIKVDDVKAFVETLKKYRK